MSNDPVPKESSLSQVVERDGRSVKVGIYEDGTGGPGSVMVGRFTRESREVSSHE